MTQNTLIQLRFKSRLFGLHVLCVRKIFVRKFLWNLQSIHFVFQITISKMRNLVAILFNLAH